MRHYKKSGMKLGTDASHTKAMKRSLACALLANDRIKTTVQRAKAIRGDVDRIVTLAKRGDLAARRLAIARLGDASLVGEIFEKAAQGMWEGRNGGYTRIMKLGVRKGDNAEVVIIEMVTEPVVKKAEPASAKPAKKTTAKKVAPRKASASKASAAKEKDAKDKDAKSAPAKKETAKAAEPAEAKADESKDEKKA